jgi:hypothetical protein
MNKIIKIIIIIIFLIPLISVVIGMNVQGETNEIKIALNTGDSIRDTYAHEIKDVIDGYHWVVNNIEYYFTTSFIDIKDIYNGSLTIDNYNVHIIDGMSDEMVACVRNPLQFDDNLRTFLENYIIDGGGYIGRCGGALLPATYDEEKPTNEYEYYLTKQNNKLFHTI